MKNWQASRYVLGSAPYVVAHGQLQAKKGKNPSVAFMGITNPCLALRAAQNTLKQTEEAESKLQRSVADLARLLDHKWRIDWRSDERPSMNFGVVHAQDLVHVDGLYQLFVCHVNSFHGRGFKSLIKHGNSTIQTGDVHLLTASPDAYTQALDEGMSLLKANQQEMATEMLQHENFEFRCHSGRHQIRNCLHPNNSKRAK